MFVCSLYEAQSGLLRARSLVSDRPYVYGWLVVHCLCNFIRHTAHSTLNIGPRNNTPAFCMEIHKLEHDLIPWVAVCFVRHSNRQPSPQLCVPWCGVVFFGITIIAIYSDFVGGICAKRKIVMRIHASQT